MPHPGRRLARGDTLLSLWELRQRVRGCFPHLRLVPVVLGGRPETSACSSTGEPTTSKPWRPRMSCPGIVPRLVRYRVEAPTAVCTDCEVALPNRFVPVTVTRSVAPTSAGVTA